MKIVCDACSAKYTIPDHKLKAKQNKVRCKKCGHTIVFSAETGTSAAVAAVDPAVEAPAVAEVASEGQWFAAIGGEQTGPLTKEALYELVSNGQVDTETLVWREGMEDWVRLADVSELDDRPAGGGTAAFGAVEEPAGAPEAPAPAAPTHEESFSSEPANDGFTAPPVQSEASSPALLGDSVIAEALATGVAPVQASDDFLRTEAPGAKGGSAAAPVFADFFSPASQSQLTGSNKMVAERSEDSVLFSLATLTQSTPAVKAGAAANDASGLIDIRVLASAAAPAQAGRAPVASIAAPVIPLPPRKKNTGLIIGVTVAGVAVVAIAAAVAVVASRPAPEAVAPAAAPTVEVAAVAPTPAPAPAVEPSAVAPEQPGSGSGLAVAAVVPEAAPAANVPAPAIERAAPRPEAAAPAAPAPAPTEVAQAPAAPAAPTPPPKKTDPALSGVLNSLRGGGAAAAAPAAPAPAPAAEAAPAPRATLTKDEVRATINRYGSRVARCKTAETAGVTVKVSFTIDPSGSVSGASSADGGTAGACVAGVVSSIKFKAFDGAAIPITYPFKL